MSGTIAYIDHDEGTAILQDRSGILVTMTRSEIAESDLLPRGAKHFLEEVFSEDPSEYGGSCPV